MSSIYFVDPLTLGIDSILGIRLPIYTNSLSSLSFFMIRGDVISLAYIGSVVTEEDAVMMVPPDYF